MARKTIKVDYLARVEGEGALSVTIREGRVTSAELKIFEPPRFFEAFLRGRAYQRGARHHRAHLRHLPGRLSDERRPRDGGRRWASRSRKRSRDLRRLLYCGEWIESHTLHVYMLHAPDFLGYDGAVEMAKDHADLVKRGLELKKTGNGLMSVIGGREIHPINVRVGGFYKAPSKRDLRAMIDPLKRARDAALETVRWVSGFDFPDCTRDYELVALHHAHEYALNEGRLVSNRGLDIGAADYNAHFHEIHVARSNALQSRTREGGAYLVGPLARFALNHDQLSPLGARRRQAGGAGRALPQPLPQHRRARRRSRLRLRRSAAHHRRLRGARPAFRACRAQGRRRLRRHRSAARIALSIATASPTTVRSSRRRSFRRPRRTRRRSRRI